MSLSKRQLLIMVACSRGDVAQHLLNSLRELDYRAVAMALTADLPRGSPQPSLIIADCLPDVWSRKRSLDGSGHVAAIPAVFLLDGSASDGEEMQALRRSHEVLVRPFTLADLDRCIRCRLSSMHAGADESGLPGLADRRRAERRGVGRRRGDGLHRTDGEHDRRRGERRCRPLDQFMAAIGGGGDALRVPPLLAPVEERSVPVIVLTDRRDFVRQLAGELDAALAMRLRPTVVEAPEAVRLFLADGGADLLMVDTRWLRQAAAGSLDQIAIVACQEGARLLLLWDDAWPLAVDEILRLGVCGSIRIDAPVSLYARALREVNRGGLWLPRWLMAQAFRGWLSAVRSTRAAAESAAAGPARSLTGRERMIARLAAEGLTNKEIARQLQVSPDTVKKHLEAVFGKLGVRRRGQVAARLFAAVTEPPRD
ncbi:LuxR C-terminal-related transcriptional regulator [Accumulibacter sp.]|uniref:helix-turn-helix transcriptional regulator n=1 Tax=Accumulibacter sp. TaxID=2053492 RepID=UPI0025DDFFB1|nr:LuxR C-terminal-related transcriptional regulator [Accumulibacter sp.]MCM8610875.1 LuxR C-terminal-related transcriptional regulator [Accumulibacter sp.]MCM8635293.1 LuxR C-terminal-related transcriptional regulator [Accumulibacter sp.]MCM8639009.1 LuxR C-terminal-related transcriptional regulator [Accumulibacter sp.]